MSEDNSEPNPFFELDPNRPPAPAHPLLQPMVPDTNSRGSLPMVAVLTLACLDVLALSMICFGIANYLTTFVDAPLIIPLYGVALLLFVFLLLNSLRVIWDHV